MRVIITVWALGLGLGVWIGQHAGDRMRDLSILEILTLIFLLVASVLVLALVTTAMRVSARGDRAAERREEVP